MYYLDNANLLTHVPSGTIECIVFGILTVKGFSGVLLNHCIIADLAASVYLTRFVVCRPKFFSDRFELKFSRMRCYLSCSIDV